MRLPLIDRQKDLKKAGGIFRAINHPLRRQILELLEEKQQANVTEIYCALSIEQSVASQHLKILRESNIVETQRKGRVIIYRVNYNHLSKLEKILSEIISD